jgi:CubicO group peptidase (beta-lactamase class C family)
MDLNIVTPESVGISASHLNEIDTAMQAFVDQNKIAGITTLIARYGKVAHFGCYGKLDLALNKPIQTDSLFRIYSLTKPITAVGALILYDEGCFNLDDPVSKWIPEFKNLKVMQDSTNINSELSDLEKEITFWHLLTHTSGLGYGLNQNPTNPIDEIYRDAKMINSIGLLQLPLQEIIQKVVELPLAAQPGATWRYSLAYDVLGYLIGLISSKPFDVFLRERIFEPLGMHDTSFYVPHGKLERFGPLYSAPKENGLSVLDDVTASPFIRPDTVPSGGCGLVTSISDYYRFMLMLANGGELDGIRLLKPDTATAMTTNQLAGSTASGPPWWSGMGYGFGVGVQETDAPRVGWIGAYGWIGISGTTAWINPREEMIVIAMPQVDRYWEASDTLLRMAREAIAT